MAGGVVGDATVRDENTVSGINNGYKCRLKKKKTDAVTDGATHNQRKYLETVHNAMDRSTREKQLKREA